DLRPRFEMTAKGPTMEQKPTEDNAKIHQLNALRKHNSDKALTNDSGANAADNEQSLRAGRRGPALLNDPDFYRKQSHLTENEFQRKWFTPVVLACMGNLS